MSGFSKALSISKEFINVKKAIETKKLPMGIVGLGNIHKAHYISALCEQLQKKCL